MFRFRAFNMINFLTPCLFIVSVFGCTWPPGYILSVVWGEVNLLNMVIPIEEALEDPNLSEHEREQLRLVIRARDYAEQVVGLNVAGSFRNFINLQGQPLAYNLSASRKDAIEAFVWDLPFVGPYPCLGFFDYDQALATRDWLVSCQYDTFMYPVDAFSTLGILPDPLSSSLLERDPVSLVDTVMHELLHNTIYHPLDNIFSESLAVFVGRTGALEFIESQYSSDASIIEQARQSYEDSDRFNAFLLELVAELNTIYDSDLSYNEKLAARKTIFESVNDRLTTDVLPLMHDPSAYEGYLQITFNNAFLLVQVRYYSDLDVYEAIYEMTGRNWPEALAIYTQATYEEHPVDFLKKMLADWNYNQ